MSQCDVVRERMAELLVEALSDAERESSHRHIEECAVCGLEWGAYRETWGVLGELPEVPVPARVRANVLEAIGFARETADVVPFRHRPAIRWVAQAAAVALLVGGSFWAGRSLDAPAETEVATAAAPAEFRLAASRTIPASLLSPVIEGQPKIDNVRLVSDPFSSELQLAFDMTSQVTVTGRAEDEGVTTLITYLLGSQDPASQSRSAAIQLVRDTMTSSGKAIPGIARALAGVIETERNEGVRLKAMDALKELPAEATSQAQAALIEVLKNDPNPAVRLKAVEALAHVARARAPLDPAMVETLREKAGQDDEILWVRQIAAEALSQIDL